MNVLNVEIKIQIITLSIVRKTNKRKKKRIQMINQ